MGLYSDPGAAGASAAGHVDAVLSMALSLGTEGLMGDPGSRESVLCLAMAVSMASGAGSPKVPVARSLNSPDLNAALGKRSGLGDAGPEEMLEALGWLASRQDAIEGRLAESLRPQQTMILCNATKACDYVQDEKGGNMRVAFSLLCTEGLEPVSARVFPLKSCDAGTIEAHASSARELFGAGRIVHAGGTEFISGTGKTGALGGGVDWIAPLTGPQVARLFLSEDLREAMISDGSAAEASHESFPGQRLVAKADPESRESLRFDREWNIRQTEAELDAILEEVEGTDDPLRDRHEISRRIRKAVADHNTKFLFLYLLDDDGLSYRLDKDRKYEESVNDGLKACRTSLEPEFLDAEGVVAEHDRLRGALRPVRLLPPLGLKRRVPRSRADPLVRGHVQLLAIASRLLWNMSRD